MPFHMRNNEEDSLFSEMNVIPLVDVSLVLLIIFIVTVNNIMTPSIRIKLPQASVTQITKTDKESIHISISNEGIMYLGDEIVTLKELKERIKQVFMKNPDLRVVLSVDKSVYFQRVVDAMDVLKDFNLSGLDIRTLQN